MSGSSTSVRDKRNYKEVQELLLLHRRYEEKAVRLFRKGLSDANTTELKTRDKKRQRSCDPQTLSLQNASTKTSGNRKKYSPNLDHEDLPKPRYLNDTDYLKQILLKSDAHGNYVGRSVAKIHWEDTNTRVQLRLPKLECIPPENKEIFYTTLPKMPSLPKLKDNSKSLKPHKKKKRNIQNSCNEANTFSAGTCLSVRQLPRDHFMLHDFGNTGSSSSTLSNVATFPRITAPREMDVSSEAITSDEGRLWLVPIVNIEIPPYRLAKWNGFKNGSLSTEEDERKILQIKAGVSSDNTAVMDSQPKYKRNVHFSEFLHEIHLYSPLSTTQSARSREDVSSINNE